MVEGRSEILLYDSTHKSGSDSFVPTTRGEAFNVTEGYLDRNFSERTLYLAAKALDGSKTERILFRPDLFSRLNGFEMVLSAAGSYLLKNDPTLTNSQIAHMKGYTILERSLIAGGCLSQEDAIARLVQEAHLLSPWQTQLTNLQERSINPYSGSQSLKERLVTVGHHDFEALKRSMRNAEKIKPGFVPDIDFEGARTEGYRSNKAQYIQRVVETLSHMSPGEIKTPAVLELQKIDLMR